jgi:hypothetical protein
MVRTCVHLLVRIAAPADVGIDSQKFQGYTPMIAAETGKYQVNLTSIVITDSSTKTSKSVVIDSSVNASSRQVFWLASPPPSPPTPPPPPPQPARPPRCPFDTCARFPFPLYAKLAFASVSSSFTRIFSFSSLLAPDRRLECAHMITF